MVDDARSRRIYELHRHVSAMEDLLQVFPQLHPGAINLEDDRRREQMLQKLQRVVLDHVPPSDDAEADAICSHMYARAIWCGFKRPLTGVWAPSEELRKLEKLRAMATKLRSAYLDVDWSLRSEMDHGYAGSHDFESTPSELIRSLLEQLESAIDAAKAAAKEGLSRKRKWRAALVLSACWSVWQHQVEALAPKALNPASRFAQFVKAVFKNLGIDACPKSIAQAWSEMQSSPAK